MAYYKIFFCIHHFFWLTESRSWVSQRIKLCIKSNGKELCLIDNVTVQLGTYIGVGVKILKAVYAPAGFEVFPFTC